MSDQAVALGRAMIMAGLLASGATGLHAQRLVDAQPLSASAPLGAVSFQRLPPKLITGDRRTYWLEGGAVGGIALGLVGMGLSSGCPANTGSCPKPAIGFLIGASVGLVIGAFLGDTIEKQPD
jgi:hypothetical protein